MKRQNRHLFALTILFAVFMSLPFLVPHCGWTALFGFVPLLYMDRLSTRNGTKRFWLWHYGAFVLWNALTTFWVCHATVGGGLFAIFANALQMSLIFGLFRWVKKRLGGILPYLFLVVTWIAWEKYYLTVAEISWPWLVLGNAFAGTVGLVQWYDVLGSLGGSLWVWLSNLFLFGAAVTLTEGSFRSWNGKARVAGVLALFLVLTGPIVWSAVKGSSWQDDSGKPLDVVVVQPNIDPYQKFVSMTQHDQTERIAARIREGLHGSDGSRPVLVLAPETITSDIILDAVGKSPTFLRLAAVLEDHPEANLLFGASTYEYLKSSDPDSYTAYRLRDGRRIQSRNSALIMDRKGSYDIYHKSKLVIGTEMLPYPKVLGPLNNALGHACATSIGQETVSLLPLQAYDREGVPMGKIPLGCAICYESVYGEHCADYVRKGARLLTVITNDAWWGNTPGYRQHLNYSRLRAIETRRSIARSANTGISALIDPKGRIVSKTEWWEPAVMTGEVLLYDGITPFVAHGDIVGRLCVFVFLLLLLASVVPGRSGKSSQKK